MVEQINVKDIQVKVIPSKLANEFVRKHHYSGKVVNMSTLHFGCFYRGVLHGVMSYGPPMDKRKVLGLVKTGLDEKRGWNSMLELNRMAFDDFLPKNSESRCLAVSIRLLRKNAPHIKWVLSFSDATQSGDGTIYRAVGFKLTQIKKNSTIVKLKSGEVIARRGDSKLYHNLDGAKPLEGFQNRYIKILDGSSAMNCRVLPYEAIDEVGAGMLRGRRITRKERQGQ